MSGFVRVQERNRFPPTPPRSGTGSRRQFKGRGRHSILARGGGRQRVVLPGLTPLDLTELPAGEPHPPLNPLNSRPCATARPEAMQTPLQLCLGTSELENRGQNATPEKPDGSSVLPAENSKRGRWGVRQNPVPI